MSASRLHTPVCDLLGIELPIVQAGMSTSTSAELVAAVSNAGGLGTIGALGRSPDDLREEIRRVRALTSKPFAVNHVISQIDDAGVELTLAQRVPVLSLSWGRAAELTERAHQAGIKVMHQVNTPEEAGAVATEGADVIVAQGSEGGGHVGPAMTTFALVPQTVDVVKPVPVIAAGGIADGRGLAAALMLGAQGVLMGTRFLATVECHGRGHSKDVLLNSLGSQTVSSKLWDDVMGEVWPGAQVRTIRHPILDQWAKRPAEWVAAADEIRPGLQAAYTNGDVVLAGQGVGLIHEILPASEVVKRIAAEADGLLG
ncbi:MAG TPA: nitronate monooxygenase family protein [Candidatus Dormibacteraeota bacterium]|nr:nitronate monooxygenase family protein [Candidatus Dormibacteraeota bacterium]